jgi:hypothetical protein
LPRRRWLQGLVDRLLNALNKLDRVEFGYAAKREIETNRSLPAGDTSRAAEGALRQAQPGGRATPAAAMAYHTLDQ